MATSSPSASIDYAQLPSVREAQGALLKAIFSHAAFDAEGDAMRGKLFYVFEETVAVNDALELAHLGDDPDGAIRGALERAIDNGDLVAAGDPAGVLLARARQKYVDRGGEVGDVDLGGELASRAAGARDAARKVLGR